MFKFIQVGFYPVKPSSFNIIQRDPNKSKFHQKCSETIQLEFPPNCAPKVKRVESSNMFKIIPLLWSQHPGLCEHWIPLNPLIDHHHCLGVK